MRALRPLAGRRAGVAVAAAALLLAAPAVAAAVTVKSHDWKIGINDGPEKKVKAGGTFKYCPPMSVGSITPNVVLAASIPKGVDFGFSVHGPAGAGTATTDEGPSTGTGTVIAPGLIPLAFPGLKAANATAFPPGTYTFTLTVGADRALTQKVKLVARAGC